MEQPARDPPDASVLRSSRGPLGRAPPAGKRDGSPALLDVFGRLRNAVEDHRAATLTVVADAHLVSDPEAITSAFGREFARMARNARRQLAKAAPAKRSASTSRKAAGETKVRRARSAR
jgi:hypothetical protein